MNRKIIFAFLTVLAGVISAGCKTDYSLEAADTAREFALEKLKGLNEEQRHFVRYTQPVLYSNLIFEQKVVPLTNVDHIKVIKMKKLPIAPEQDMMHHCFVWAPPGLEANVVVVGAGERSLRFWSPVRVLLKNYIPDDTDYESAKNQAKNYAASYREELTPQEWDRIRFSEPEVLYTRFPLTWKAEDSEQVLTPWETYMKDLRARTETQKIQEGKAEEIILTQLSLVWKADQDGKMIVFSGFSRFGCLNGWKPQQVLHMENAEIEQGTLTEEEIRAIVKKPGESTQVFPAEEPVDRGNKGKDSGATFGKSLMY